jgi:hypothetical protein
VKPISKRLFDRLQRAQEESELRQSDGSTPALTKIATFLAELGRRFLFQLIAGPFSLGLYLALAIYFGVIVAVIFELPPIYPVAVSCLVIVIINPKRMILAARAKRDQHYRP